MRRGIGTGLAVAATLAALTPATAFAGWTSPRVLSGADGSAEGPHVAIDAGGDSTFVWRAFDPATEIWTVDARVGSTAGALGPIHTIATGASGDQLQTQQVGVDAGGNAVVVWRSLDSGRVQARTLSAGGTLGPVQDLSPAGDGFSSNPQLAVNANGDGIVVWEHHAGFNTGRIQARRITIDGSLGPIRDIAMRTNTDRNLNTPRVGIDSAGDAVFSWAGWDGSRYHSRTRTLTAGGVLTAQRAVSAPNPSPAEPVLAVNPDGDAAFAWVEQAGPDYLVRGRIRDAGGSMQPTHTLSRPGNDASSPTVAIDPGGDAVFAWRRYRVQTRTLTAGGALTPVQALSASETAAVTPAVGVNSSGASVFVWRLSRGSRAIQARTRAPGGALGSIQTLSPAGRFDPDVAVDPAGAAAATWALATGRVQAAFGP